MARIVGNKISLTLNIIAAAVISYGSHVVRKLVLPANLQEAGHLQFLTNLSAVLTVVYYAISIVAHLSKSQNIYYAKNNYLLPVVLALEFVVSTVYWTLRFFATYLITFEEVPFALDFTLHITPLVSLAIDYFYFLPAVTISAPQQLGLCAVLTGSYWLWLEYLIDVEKGQSYPYPFLNVETPKRAVIFVIVGLVAFGGFTVLKKLHELIVPLVIYAKQQANVKKHS